MKIQYFSDLHLEFLKKNFNKLLSRIVPVAPVLVLAGDIGLPSNKSYEELLTNVSDKFTKVFVIAGNHEYYGNTLPETNTRISSICQRLPNVSFLNNSFEDYQGVRFVGSTLWSKITDVASLTNDFSMIKGLTVTEYNRLYSDACDFVNNTLSSATNEQRVVMITHHLPSHSLVDPCYSRYRRYQQCFASDLDHLIRSPVVCWIYGHTHKPFFGVMTSVKMCCNPIGYPGENATVDFEKFVEI